MHIDTQTHWQKEIPTNKQTDKQPNRYIYGNIDILLNSPSSELCIRYQNKSAWLMFLRYLVILLFSHNLVEPNLLMHIAENRSLKDQVFVWNIKIKIDVERKKLLNTK